jgi:hypothetical protein
MHTHAATLAEAEPLSFMDRLNGPWHERALQVFMAIVLAHWAEHLVQAFQIYVLKWPVPQSLGILGLFYPWLIRSEVLHYGYAIVMLVGIFMLRPGFTEHESRRWWTIALVIQFFHHFEHALLFGQALTGHNLFDRPVPTSLIQLWVPRVELHLFYNTIVFIPMMIGMYYHMFPPQTEAASEPRCTCAWNKGISATA